MLQMYIRFTTMLSAFTSFLKCQRQFFYANNQIRYPALLHRLLSKFCFQRTVTYFLFVLSSSIPHIYTLASVHLQSYTNVILIFLRILQQCKVSLICFECMVNSLLFKYSNNFFYLNSNSKILNGLDRFAEYQFYRNLVLPKLSLL